MEDAVVVQGLSHWCGEDAARWQALRDISLSVPRGSFTVLCGPSGCGKSTLLTLMGGLRRIQQGSVRLLQTELHGADEAQLRAMRRRLGVILQAHNLHDSLGALQNVLVGLQVHGQGGDLARQEEVAAGHMPSILGLAGRVDQLPDRLSGGEKQRVAIARALVLNPQVILADEPTAALDSAASNRVVELLRALGRKRGTSTLLITHDERIHRQADQVLMMEDDEPGAVGQAQRPGSLGRPARCAGAHPLASEPSARGTAAASLAAGLNPSRHFAYAPTVASRWRGQTLTE